MEQVSIPIPAALYTAIYERYEDQTTATITTWLEERLKSTAGPASMAAHTSARYPRPRPGTKTGRVWEIADKIERETGQASREAVIRACMDEGLNVNTASTQYSYWRSSRS